ncbi:hypothetical protein CLG85_020965 [Yangia mangrovi]|uniref:AlgX/AlgJ SGNH hydrolase-like domain-containing protein n=1 Tax=Alloyangia mangrovi TaxID=1779329 RepID=A0ABT2KRA1_9RHOB|nr:hypothetical protein [Alloyangia mangrovi]
MSFPHSVNFALKLVVPVAFFGYAAAANMALVLGPATALPQHAGLGRHGMTQEIDTLYREGMPHRDLAIRLIGAARYLLLNEGRPGVAVGAGGVLFTDEELRQPAAAGAAYAAALDEIVRSAEALRASGTELIVVPVPAKLDLLAAQGPDPALSEELHRFYDRFRADLTDREIPTVDSRSALAALAAPFLATDTHWTPGGRPGRGGADRGATGADRQRAVHTGAGGGGPLHRRSRVLCHLRRTGAACRPLCRTRDPLRGRLHTLGAGGRAGPLRRSGRGRGGRSRGHFLFRQPQLELCRGAEAGAGPRRDQLRNRGAGTLRADAGLPAKARSRDRCNHGPVGNSAALPARPRAARDAGSGGGPRGAVP